MPKTCKYLYIIGQRFGFIEPLEYMDKSKFRCKCHNCGNEQYVNTAQHLLSGEIKSCGCLPKYKDITNNVVNGFKAIKFVRLQNGKAIWQWQCINCGNVREGSSFHATRFSCICRRKQQKEQEFVGREFSNLTVVSFAYIEHQRRYWKCKCACGNIKIVSTHDLTGGYVKSCGCLRTCSGKDRYGFKDISGRTFGNLTAISHVHGKYWKFRCNLCHKEKIMRNIDVISGKCYSCGCINLAIRGSKAENEIRDYVNSLILGGEQYWKT